MAIPQSNHVDDLLTGTLRGPLLDDYYGSPIQRADVIRVAREIERRHLALLPTDTGNLKRHARVTAARSPNYRDRRFVAEYEIGGEGADYIIPLEDEGHYLDRALRDMGFYTPDSAIGPTGKLPNDIERGPDGGTFAERAAERMQSLRETGELP